jgi:preprotein translocase subunit SecD
MAKYIRIWILAIALLLTFSLIFFKGLDFGIDFKGGTIFQVHFSKPLSPEELAIARQTVEQRVNWTGLKDTNIRPAGNQYLIVEIAESNPDNIIRIENLLKSQGSFEATIDGKVLFTGSDLKVIKDPAQGYRIAGNNQWTLPFSLNSKAADSFAKRVFHKCKGELDCEQTFFFIDRPVGGLLLIPEELISDSVSIENAFVDFNKLIANTGADYLALKTNESGKTYLSEEQKLQLSAKKYVEIAFPSSLREEDIDFIRTLGIRLREVQADDPILLAKLTNIRSVIALTPNIANVEAPSINSPQFQRFTNLVINGGAQSKKEAESRLKDLTVILESGTLPAPIDDISKETISASLGFSFLKTVAVALFIAFLIVGIILYLRYRYLGLVIPIMITSFSEIAMVLGLSALFRWNLDFSAIAGILASVGTGVNDQIVITDEILTKEHTEIKATLLKRIANAFYVIFAAAATISAALLPIIFSSLGLGRLVGFAITSLAGIAVGILITRPAYNEAIRFLVKIKE